MLRAKSVLRNRCVLLGAVAGISLASSHTDAAVIYGNFVGPNVTYQNVTEAPTQVPGPTPTQLFGPPTLSGDTLMFDPLNFIASASGGSIEFQDGHLTANIVPTPPHPTITSISLMEGGGWAVGGGTSATTAEESLIINQLFITSVNGVSVNPIVVVPAVQFTDTETGTATVIKTPTSIQFNSSGGMSTGSWNGVANFNLAAALASAGLSGNVTGLSLNLDNQLAATSETNSVSFIDKKFFNIDPAVSPVPEPATATAMVLGAIGLLARRSRRHGPAFIR